MFGWSGRRFAACDLQGGPGLDAVSDLHTNLPILFFSLLLSIHLLLLLTAGGAKWFLFAYVLWTLHLYFNEHVYCLLDLGLANLNSFTGKM